MVGASRKEGGKNSGVFHEVGGPARRRGQLGPAPAYDLPEAFSVFEKLLFAAGRTADYAQARIATGEDNG